jgi:hypothetical protein
MQGTDLSFARFAAARLEIARIPKFLQVIFIVLIAFPVRTDTRVNGDK